jgi:hypothetical protein
VAHRAVIREIDRWEGVGVFFQDGRIIPAESSCRAGAEPVCDPQPPPILYALALE